MTDLFQRIRQWLGDTFRGWGFTAFERKAILVLCLLIMIASGFRYYRNRSLALKLTSFATTDSLADPYSEPEPPLHLLVDINQATQHDLERLPGIGPVKAGKILALRDSLRGFSTIEQLDQVEGIGAKTIERLRPFIVTGQRSPETDSIKKLD